jgi:vacuolar-type H+-ATPase subunit I/STV1
MKAFTLILTLCLGAAAFAGDLTNAAKGAKSKRQKSKSKVITNADVKKSTGKVVETANIPATPVEKELTLTEQHEANKAAHKAANELRTKHEQLVAGLEKELAALEQQYYEENDLNRRDTEIVKKFNDVKAKLDATRMQIQ